MCSTYCCCVSKCPPLS